MIKTRLILAILLTIAISTMSLENAYANTPNPSSLTATVISSTQIDLSWDAGTGSGSSHTQSILRCSGAGCTPTTVIATSATATPLIAYSDIGLSPSTVYRYQISTTHTGFTTGVSNITPDTLTSPAPVDTTPPVVTGSTTNIVSGGSTELTNTDQYVEFCTATDETAPPTPACTVQSGGIDTSILGLQSVTYEATDTAGNIGTAVISTTVVDTTSPSLALNGIDPETVSITDPYVDAGATVSDNNNTVDGTTIACDDSAVDVNTAGSYTVTCDFTDPSGNSATQITRTVDVIDNIAPVITLIGADPQTIFITDPYVELGATALDVNDGDISGSIIIDASAVDVNTVGSYPVTYDVTDSAGNPATQVTRTVDVVDNIIPVITRLGDETVNIQYGSTYVDAGATALDVNDGDISGSIVVGGLPIDTFIPSATYTITYDVADSSGNNAVQVTRTVKIGTSGGNEDVWDTRPTFGMNPVKQDQRVVDCGFGMDQTCFDMTDIWHTPFEKIVINTGESHDFQLNILAQQRLKDAGFCLVPSVGSMEGELCMGVSLDGNGIMTGTTITQKEGLVDESQITFSATKDGAFYNIKINGVKFLDQPYYEVIGLYAVDYQPLSTNQFLNEGMDVVGISYLPPLVTSIPTHEKVKYGESGMITLTRVDKFENVWATDEGILYTFNNYGTPEKLSSDTISQITDDAQMVMTRSNSNFQLLVDWSTDQAEQKMKQMYPNMFKEKSFAEINNIFSHTSEYVNHKKILADSLFN